MGNILTGEGFADAKSCPNCKNYYEGYNTSYRINDEFRCPNCLKDDVNYKTKPCFITSIPSFCDGATCEIFTFDTVDEFFGIISKEVNKNQILVKSNNSIMVQNLDRSYWWVLGYIKNMNINLINIPNVNYEIYNGNAINDKKFKEWVREFNGKQILLGKLDSFYANKVLKDLNIL